MMESMMDNIMEAVVSVTSVDETEICGASHVANVTEARRVFVSICKAYGIPTLYVSERIGRCRWTVNRLNSESSEDKSYLHRYYLRMCKKKLDERHEVSTKS